MNVLDGLEDGARATSHWVVGWIRAAGSGVDLLFETIRRIFVKRPRVRPVLDQMYSGGVLSIPIVVLVNLFTGMALTLQTGLELQKFGQQDLVGNIVSVAMCREFGPFITGIILAAAVGSAMAAELGTMAVSEELTALDVMTVDKTRFLVLPRFVALALMCPLLTTLADLIGIVGGGIVAAGRLNVSAVLYANSAVETLRGEAILGVFPRDVYVGLLKAVVFGATIAIVGCATGMRARNGAQGVGRATRSAVRASILLIVVLNYVITGVFFGLLPS